MNVVEAVLIQKGLLSSNLPYGKRKGIEVEEKVVSANAVLFLFFFLYQIFPKKLRSLPENVPSFYDVES